MPRGWGWNFQTMLSPTYYEPTLPRYITLGKSSMYEGKVTAIVGKAIVRWNEGEKPPEIGAEAGGVGSLAEISGGSEGSKLGCARWRLSGGRRHCCPIIKIAAVILRLNKEEIGRLQDNNTMKRIGEASTVTTLEVH